MAQEAPYPVKSGPVQQRNLIAPGTDRDTGVDAEGIQVPPVNPADVAKIIALSQRHLLKMLRDQAFDYTHPVDEYAPQGSPGPIASLTVQADYDMPERIETVLVISPIGCTNTSIQLGQRTLQLYSGAALATPLVSTLQVRGLIINSDDPRIATFSGTITSQPYLGLTGWALTRGQFS